MIIDTSAIIAILAAEPEAPSFIAKMSAEACLLSAGTLIELSAILTRRGIASEEDLHRLLRVARISIEPVTSEQAWIGFDAYRRYGIGSQHSARLNFGDCFAYALAKATGEPLLFKGKDFARTDVLVA